MALQTVFVRIHLTGLIAMVPRGADSANPDQMVAVLVDTQSQSMQHEPALFWRETDAEWVPGAYSLQDRRVTFGGTQPFSLQNHQSGFGMLPRSPSEAGYIHWLPKLKELGVMNGVRPAVLAFPTSDSAVAAQVVLQNGMLRTQKLTEYNGQIVKLQLNGFQRAAAIAVVLEETMELEGGRLQVTAHDLENGVLRDQFYVDSYVMGPHRYIDILVSNSSIDEHTPYDEAQHFKLLSGLFKSPPPMPVPKVVSGTGVSVGLQPGVGGLWDLPVSLQPLAAAPHQHALTGNLNSRPICPMVEVEEEESP